MKDLVIGPSFPFKVIPLIEQAKKSIDIIVFDWRFYPNEPANPAQKFNNALISAVRRGVEVRGVSNMRDIGETLNKLGCKIRKLTTKRLVHIKLMIIDDSLFVIGSHNYTQSAFSSNYEMSVILDDQNLLKESKEFFNNLYYHG